MDVQLLGRWMGLGLLLLLPAAGQGHQTKDTDLNGGHYDDFGNYHCHLASCEMTESRHQRRRGIVSNTQDYEKFYLEEDWPHWVIVSGRCTDTRNAVLAATSRTPVSYATPRECTVREGLWIDEYTGEEYTRAGRLAVDHIIPPQYANATNGYQWSLQKRQAFANDPINLVPVSRDIQRRKRSRGIGAWRPPREAFHCEYAAAWRDVSNKYDLDLTPRDTGRMRNILEECEAEESPDVRD